MNRSRRCDQLQEGVSDVCQVRSLLLKCAVGKARRFGFAVGEMKNVALDNVVRSCFPYSPEWL